MTPPLTTFHGNNFDSSTFKIQFRCHLYPVAFCSPDGVRKPCPLRFHSSPVFSSLYLPTSLFIYPQGGGPSPRTDHELCLLVWVFKFLAAIFLKALAPLGVCGHSEATQTYFIDMYSLGLLLRALPGFTFQSSMFLFTTSLHSRFLSVCFIPLHSFAFALIVYEHAKFSFYMKSVVPKWDTPWHLFLWVYLNSFIMIISSYCIHFPADGILLCTYIPHIFFIYSSADGPLGQSYT